MDIANQLFSLTLGVEPNKQTLQNLAGTLNSAGMYDHVQKMSYEPLFTLLFTVVSLADKQKALEQYADTVEAQKFVSNAPIPQPNPQLSQQQIQYIQAAPTPQAAQARKAKALRDPVVWQISEKQLKELQWKRKQLLQAQKAELEKKRKERANRPPPPKLGQSKAALARAEQGKKDAAQKDSAKAPAAKAQQKKAPPKPNPSPAKAPAKTPAKPTAKPSTKAPAKAPRK
ncbi:MAG: hypothetical protein Q9163_002727 [Psora crenata]